MPKIPRTEDGITTYLGIDPGLKGGMALVTPNGRIAYCAGSYLFEFKDKTEHQIADWVRGLQLEFQNPVAVLEKVRSMPGQGVASTFKFGWSYGFLRGLIASLEIPLYMEPVPAKWQRELSCLTKGDKQVSLRRAHELFPHSSKEITLGTADAALIAEWGRRQAIGANQK